MLFFAVWFCCLGFSIVVFGCLGGGVVFFHRFGGGVGPAQTAKKKHPKSPKRFGLGAGFIFSLFGRAGEMACCCFFCLVSFVFAVWAGGRVFLPVWAGVFTVCPVWVGDVFVFVAVWAGSVFISLLFGRGTGVRSLTSLRGSSLRVPTTKKTKQQKKRVPARKHLLAPFSLQ